MLSYRSNQPSQRNVANSLTRHKSPICLCLGAHIIKKTGNNFCSGNIYIYINFFFLSSQDSIRLKVLFHVKLFGFHFFFQSQNFIFNLSSSSIHHFFFFGFSKLIFFFGLKSCARQDITGQRQENLFRKLVIDDLKKKRMCM